MKRVGRRVSLTIALLVSCAAGAAEAQTALPKEDKPASADSPLVKRAPGSVIIGYEHKNLEEFAFPVGKLGPAPGKKRDAHSRVVFAPKKAKTVTGPYTRILYLLAPNSSSLEAMRTLTKDLREAKGAKVLFECKEAECGGDPHRNTVGTSLGDQSLAMVLYPESRASEPYASPAYCIMNASVDKQRYVVIDLPGGAGTVSVHAYEAPDNAGGNCKAFTGATVAAVDIVAAAKR